MLRRQHRFFRSVLIASDCVVICAAIVASFFIRFDLLAERFPPREMPDADAITFATHSIPVVAAAVIMILTMVGTGLYQPRRDQRFQREAWIILKAIVLGVMFTVATVSFLSRLVFDGRDPSRVQYLVYASCLLVFLLTWRFTFRAILRALRRRGFNLRHVAIIGNGRLGQIVARTLDRNSWTGITPTFFVSHESGVEPGTCAGLPVKGGLDELERILDGTDLTGVFIAIPGDMGAALPNLLARLERHPVDVRVVPDMNPKYFPMNMAVAELEGMPILSLRESPLSGWGGIAKRGVDLLGALVAIAIFAIPMLLITVLVRRSGPGPIVFRQERMSLNGQRFRIFKFRTMRHVTGEARAMRDQGSGTDNWTRGDDPEITRIGRFLRRTSLDELPQLFNVLLGEMSLVGPRPERPELIKDFRNDWRGYMLRQNVKAGMTGWAQVNGLRGDTSLRKRLQYDLFYIRNWSLGFDLRILWMTIFRGFIHPNAQ